VACLSRRNVRSRTRSIACPCTRAHRGSLALQCSVGLAGRLHTRPSTAASRASPTCRRPRTASRTVLLPTRSARQFSGATIVSVGQFSGATSYLLTGPSAARSNVAPPIAFLARKPRHEGFKIVYNYWVHQKAGEASTWIGAAVTRLGPEVAAGVRQLSLTLSQCNNVGSNSTGPSGASDETECNIVAFDPLRGNPTWFAAAGTAAGTGAV
jgi:hypothetical protein